MNICRGTKMKRENNSGSITKLKGNRRRPYRARVIQRNADGARKWVTIGYFENEDKAKDALAKARIMPPASDSDITLAGLYEQWKKTQAYIKLSKQTQANYETAYKNYMADYHNKRFDSLRLIEFQAMVDKAQSAGRSRSTMEKIKWLSVILGKYAFTNDIVYKVYAESVVLPKKEKKHIDTFSETEIKTLFKNDAVPYVDSVLMLIYTGMRINELLKLTKFDVDLENMLIIGGSKTDAGENRIVPIHPKIQKYFAARLSVCENYLFEIEREVGNKKRGDKQTRRVRLTYEHYRDYIYYDLLETLGIRRLTPHKARHTFFTMMSDKCTDRKAMAIVGGHTDPNFTDKTYVQPDIERLRRAVECI